MAKAGKSEKAEKAEKATGAAEAKVAEKAAVEKKVKVAAATTKKKAETEKTAAGKKPEVAKAIEKKPAVATEKKPAGKVSGTTVAIIVAACVAVLALVLVVCMAVTGGVGPKELPKMSITGEEASDWQKEGKVLRASEEVATTCTIANRNLDSDLRPMVGESANSSNTGAGKYGAYSSLECVAKIEGSYDEYKSGAKLSLGTNEGEFKLVEKGNKFELTHTYRVFADMTGAPKATPYTVVLMLKDKNGNVLSEYNLAVKVTLSAEDKKFIAEWKAKIDEKIAQKEQEEKEKAEKEAAERESALNNAITPNYTDLFRNWRSYQGKYIRITGRIVQTDSSNSFCRVATEIYRKSASTYAAKYRYSSDDVIYVAPCNPGTKLLEDDVISVVGEAAGNYTYQTVIGGTIEIPKIKGIRFWLLDHVE